MEIVAIALICFFVILIFSGFNSQKRANEKKRAMIERRETEMNSLIEQRLFDEPTKDALLQLLEEQGFAFESVAESEIKNVKTFYERYWNLENKYGDEIATKVLKHDFWIGMPEQILIDAFGEPDKTEIETVQSKTKRTLVYEKETLVFINGECSKIIIKTTHP